jgi:sporulation-control protein spo0M
MSITIILNTKNSVYPGQETTGSINFSSVPSGKTKMQISNVKSNTNSFYVTIVCRSSGSKKEISHTLTAMDNREISLINDADTSFDNYYITLNLSTISSEHEIGLDIDFS